MDVGGAHLENLLNYVILLYNNIYFVPVMTDYSN